VARDDRQVRRELAVGDVQVGAAHAASHHFHEHLPGRGDGNVHRVALEGLARPVQAHGGHGDAHGASLPAPGGDALD
jgi:hypothetical protein